MTDVVYLSAARGLNLARVAIAKALSQNDRDAYGFSMGRWGPAAPPTVHLKSVVEGGTTLTAPWAAPLGASTLSDEFLAFMRGDSALEQLIPSMQVTEFNTRTMIESDASIVASWVGEGAGKPLTFGTFSTVELVPHKLTADVPATKETLRASSLESKVRRSMADALTLAQDQAFLSDDPALSSSPAGILNGIPAIPSVGDPVVDGAALRASFQGNKKKSVLVMHPDVGADISARLSLENVGARGGELWGFPVITSEHVPSDSSGTAVILVDPTQILVAVGPVEPRTNTHGSVQFLDNPTNDAATGAATTLVSLFQTDTALVRAERYVSWRLARAAAVAWLSGVDYSTST